MLESLQQKLASQYERAEWCSKQMKEMQDKYYSEHQQKSEMMSNLLKHQKQVEKQKLELEQDFQEKMSQLQTQMFSQVTESKRQVTESLYQLRQQKRSMQNIQQVHQDELLHNEKVFQ